MGRYSVLWLSVWGDTLYAYTIDPQFLSPHGNFGFQLVDSGLFGITVSDQGFAASEHGDSHDPDDIEHRISNASVPVPLEEAMLPYPADRIRHTWWRSEISHHSRSRPRSCDATDMADESRRFCFCTW